MRKSWVLGILVGSLYAGSALANVMVLPVDGTNLEPVEEEAVWQLFASAYQAARRDTVLPESRTRAALESTGNYSDAARELGAAEYIYVSAVRLKERIVLSASLFRADGSLLHSAKMTAASLDDVEPAAERLAKALVGRTTPKTTRELETVTKAESKQPTRTWVEKVNGVKAGVTYPLGYGHEIAPMLSFGYNGRFEGASHFLELGAGFTIPAQPEDFELSYGGIYAELGANFYLANSSASPYLGGGVLPRLAGRGITNLAAYVQGGMMFFRESSSRLYADLRVAQNLLPLGFEGEYDPVTSDYTNDDLKLYPTEFTLSVGLGF